MQEHFDTLFKYIAPAKLIEWGFLAIQFVGVIVIAFVVLKLMKGGIHQVGLRMHNRAHSLGEQKRVTTLIRVFEYIATILVWLVGSLIALGTIGIAIAPILAAAGVVGLAVGFGSQSLVKDYFTGVILLMENQIRAGDTIEILGRTGTVENVTLRYVRLRDGDGNVHFVPNGQITAVNNMTMDFTYAVVDIRVAPKANVDKASELMQQVGQNLVEDEAFKTRILEPLVFFGIQSFSESAIVLRVRFKTLAGEQWPVKREFYKRIKQAFDEAGIEMPFAAPAV